MIIITRGDLGPRAPTIQYHDVQVQDHILRLPKGILPTPDKIPENIKHIDMTGNPLGADDLLTLYLILLPHINNRDRTIEIIADDQLYASLQELINFENLLAQISEFIMQNPKKIPSPDQPINLNQSVTAYAARQYIDIIQSRKFAPYRNYAAIVTLASLYSGGIINEYAAKVRFDSEKLSYDYRKARVYMALWHLTYFKQEPELREQITQLIQELGIEHNISTQRQPIVKKYCDWWQNQFADFIGYAIIRQQLKRIEDVHIVTEIQQLIAKLQALSMKQHDNPSEVLQILDQIYYWLNMFFNYHRESPAIVNLIELFEANKKALLVLNHKILVEKCAMAHADFCANNQDIVADTIPQTPFDELFLSLHIKSLAARVSNIVKQFQLTDNINFTIYTDNVTVESLISYTLWDNNLNRQEQTELNLLLALFYAGVIFSSNQPHAQIDLHKAIIFLYEYATANDSAAKQALYLLPTIINNNIDAMLQEPISVFLNTYGHFDSRIADNIKQLMRRTTSINHGPIIFSNLSGSQSTVQISSQKNKCCSIM